GGQVPGQLADPRLQVRHRHQRRIIGVTRDAVNARYRLRCPGVFVHEFDNIDDYRHSSRAANQVDRATATSIVYRFTMSSQTTLLTLARALGVSRTTVSNAYSRPEKLSPELRERILATARELGYEGPNALASLLRTGRTEVVGVLFTDD